MENEIRYYLKQILAAMQPGDGYEAFKPQHMVLAIQDATGRITIETSSQDIEQHIEWVLNNYDEDMFSKVEDGIRVANMMIV